MLDSRPLLLDTDFPPIFRGKLSVLQVNLGYKCNLSCVHCHVNAGPSRTEMMDLATIEQVLDFARCQGINTLDLTGGAPEMNPHFRYMVSAARALDIEVIDRCNLTILQEPGFEDMAEFLAENKVVITASLPCYEEENVEKQRGKGVYEHSIDALVKLNALGYGIDSTLPLNLVYNPTEPVLPPPQAALEQEYKQELLSRHNIRFNELFTITNMPISRYGAILMSQGQFTPYMDLLKANFSSDNLPTLMCRSILSVDYRGYVYDCDFNQMLEMPLGASDRPRPHLSELLELDFNGREIMIGDHCFACAAGSGSSCGGALND
jgi:radical SAM/Cys-rich protein